MWIGGGDLKIYTRLDLFETWVILQYYLKPSNHLPGPASLSNVSICNVLLVLFKVKTARPRVKTGSGLATSEKLNHYNKHKRVNATTQLVAHLAFPDSTSL